MILKEKKTEVNWIISFKPEPFDRGIDISIPVLHCLIGFIILLLCISNLFLYYRILDQGVILFNLFGSCVLSPLFLFGAIYFWPIIIREIRIDNKSIQFTNEKEKKMIHYPKEEISFSEINSIDNRIKYKFRVVLNSGDKIVINLVGLPDQTIFNLLEKIKKKGIKIIEK